MSCKSWSCRPSYAQHDFFKQGMIMNKPGQNLIFYDGQCGLCDRTVQLLLDVDKDRIFKFAPLQGSTAKALLQDVPNEIKTADSLILIEQFETDNKKIYILAKAALHICWLLGGWWMLLGWISFLPGFLYNWVYRIIAKNRTKIFSQSCILPRPTSDRFLP